MNIDKRLLAYKPISITLNFDWENTTYDERVLARHNYIEEQKKKDPNYVGYDFPEHFSSTHAGRRTKDTKQSVHTVDFSKLINTLGQAISIARNKVFVVLPSNTKWYRYMYTTINGESSRLRINRVVACTFIPIPEHLKSIRENLVVNHKNDIKNCNLRSNLEWCTQKENVIKAVETGVIKSSSYMFTITRPGLYFGNTYYFTDIQSLTDHGFDYTGVIKSANNTGNYLCGIWETISKEMVQNKKIGMDDEVIEYLRDPKYGNSHAKASVGTIVTEGPCKGERFALYGRVELNKYGFCESCVSKVASGKSKFHKGCTWERMTREEATNIPIGLTDKQITHLFKK